MPVVETRYAVEGWGVGELWARDGVVLAHWFDFDASRAAAIDAGERSSPEPPLELLGGAAPARGPSLSPPMGGVGPPARTLAASPVPRGDAFVPEGERLGALRAALVERFRAYLAGVPESFEDVELDLGDCTPFQRAATIALRAVPRGEVVTYGELAALAGHPGAHRAAGTFCAGNRFAFLVPCHRVVAADGIGGYGSTGVGVKRRLLALEGVYL